MGAELWARIKSGLALETLEECVSSPVIEIRGSFIACCLLEYGRETSTFLSGRF